MNGSGWIGLIVPILFAGFCPLAVKILSRWGRRGLAILTIATPLILIIAMLALAIMSGSVKHDVGGEGNRGEFGSLVAEVLAWYVLFLLPFATASLEISALAKRGRSQVRQALSGFLFGLPFIVLMPLLALILVCFLFHDCL
jgi:hypothetical protein